MMRHLTWTDHCAYAQRYPSGAIYSVFSWIRDEPKLKFDEIYLRNYSEVINPINVARLEVEWTSINPSSANMNLNSRGTINKPQ